MFTCQRRGCMRFSFSLSSVISSSWAVFPLQRLLLEAVGLGVMLPEPCPWCWSSCLHIPSLLFSGIYNSTAGHECSCKWQLHFTQRWMRKKKKSKHTHKKKKKKAKGEHIVFTPLAVLCGLHCWSQSSEVQMKLCNNICDVIQLLISKVKCEL